MVSASFFEIYSGKVSTGELWDVIEIFIIDLYEGIRFVERQSEIEGARGRQTASATGRPVREIRRFRRRGTETDHARQQRADVGIDVGQRALVALARRFPSDPSTALQFTTSRQILPGRFGRKRKRSRHLLGQSSNK